MLQHVFLCPLAHPRHLQHCSNQPVAQWACLPFRTSQFNCWQQVRNKVTSSLVILPNPTVTNASDHQCVGFLAPQCVHETRMAIHLVVVHIPRVGRHASDEFPVG